MGCSRCYKCSRDVIYNVNGVKDTSKIEEDVCTATAKELEDKEDAGYTCVPS